MLPRAAAFTFGKLAQYGPRLLLLILFADWYLHVGILSLLMRPFLMLAQTIVFGAVL